MFDSTKNLNTRVTDTVDLFIDFATLGEYGLEPLETVGRTRQGCADLPAAIQRIAASTATSPRPPRAKERAASCDLLQESGLCKPTSARVEELQALRKHRDIRTAGAPKKERRRPTPSQIKIFRSSALKQSPSPRGPRSSQARKRGVRVASGTLASSGAA